MWILLIYLISSDVPTEWGRVAAASKESCVQAAQNMIARGEASDKALYCINSTTGETVIIKP